MRGPVLDRVARVVFLAAWAWFVVTAAWGVLAIPAAGHLGAGNAGTFMAAEQMIRWKILYPGRSWYTGIKPEGAALMCHHPYGQYYVPAVLYWLFGHHDYLIHVPAIFTSAAIPPLLYGIAKERWGATGGAVAVAGFVVVPIAVGFSCYWNLESICILGTLLYFWGHTRHMRTSQTRYLVASMCGLVIACTGDWVGYLLVSPTLGWALARAYLLPARATPRFRREEYGRWWALSIVIMILLLLWIIGLFAYADQISQWLGAEEARGGGKGAPLKEVLASRAAWIDFSFTPLAIWVGKVAAPVCALRLLWVRRDEETYALSFLFGAVVQYVAFKRGADVHIYWSHYFAAYFALALAELSGSLRAVLAWVLARLGRPRKTLAAAVGLAIGLCPAVAMAHDGVSSLMVWQRTGGRYDEHGGAIRSNVDLLFVLQEYVLPRTTRGMPIDTHRGFGWGWEFTWKYEGVGNTVDAPSLGADAAKHPFWVARASALRGDDQRKIAAEAHVRAFGDAWIVDQREGPALIDAYDVEEREPNWLEKFLYGGTEPMRTLGKTPDPWKTWDWRVHLGQPAPLPVGQPQTLEQMRIAHNAAIAAGDEASAARWRQAIDAQLDHAPATAFTHGVSLIGVRLTNGAQAKVECWLELARDASLSDVTLDVRSKVEARAPLSLIPPDPQDREMVSDPIVATKLWKPRFLYAVDVVLNHRIGRERYTAGWRSRDGSPPPARTDGKPTTTLAVLP